MTIVCMTIVQVVLYTQFSGILDDKESCVNTHTFLERCVH